MSRNDFLFALSLIWMAFLVIVIAVVIWMMN
jgi:hypothetical protein